MLGTRALGWGGFCLSLSPEPSSVSGRQLVLNTCVKGGWIKKGREGGERKGGRGREGEGIGDNSLPFSATQGQRCTQQAKKTFLNISSGSMYSEVRCSVWKPCPEPIRPWFYLHLISSPSLRRAKNWPEITCWLLHKK